MSYKRQLYSDEQLMQRTKWYIDHFPNMSFRQCEKAARGDLEILALNHDELANRAREPILEEVTETTSYQKEN